MFGKLLKHEFRATGRTALPLCAAMLALAVPAHFSIRANDGWFRGSGTIQAIVIILYVLSFFAVGIGVLVTVIQRFHKNVLGDEGYLTMTLPVSLHGILGAKLITAIVWYLLSGALVVLSVMIAGMDAEDWSALPRILNVLFTEDGVFWMNAGQVALFVLEVLAMAAEITLLFYAAMAIGYSFNRRKGLLSVIAFLALNAALRVVTVRGFYELFGQAELSGEFVMDRVLVPMLAGTIFCAALLYLITWWCLRRRLNLE